MPSSPFALALVGGAVFVAGIGIGAWILRWEIRAQRRQRRHGGFLIGGER